MDCGLTKNDGSGDLDVDWLTEGWVTLFRKWFDDARVSGVIEPSAMVVATVAEGRPFSRTVLCNNADETGVTFFTHHDSAKGVQLAAAPYASATFPWYGIGRQIHVRGPVSMVDRQVTEVYWRKRSRESQLASWSSRQSLPIASRLALRRQLAEVTERFADSEHVPVPPNWGGYCIGPEMVEFWQGRNDRVHNRVRVCDGQIERVQP